MLAGIFSEANLLRLFLTMKRSQVGMNGDTFSTKAPKECSKKFVASLKRKSLTRGDVLRIFSCS